MNLAKEARKLADYIVSLGNSFQEYEIPSHIAYNHIGALFTDIILQAGLNYQTIVAPRVNKILIDYPEADTVIDFKILIEEEGLENIINWKNPIKLIRIQEMISFSMEQDINTCNDFRVYLSQKENQKKVLEINGIGFKTLDYLLKLLSFDTVAVDRHISSFVKLADIEILGYYQTKKIVEYAADFLEISRTSIDYSIWKYMSDKKSDFYSKNAQLAMQFA